MTSDDDIASWNERADRFCNAWSSGVVRPPGNPGDVGWSIQGVGRFDR